MTLADRSCAMLKQTFKDHEVNPATSVNGDQSEFKTLNLFPNGVLMIYSIRIKVSYVIIIVCFEN